MIHLGWWCDVLKLLRCLSVTGGKNWNIWNWHSFYWHTLQKKKQVPRGYIRCDLFVGTHLSLLSSLLLLVIWSLSNLKNSDFRRSKITRDRRTDGRTDGPTDGRTDRPSYRDSRTHLKKIEDFPWVGCFKIALFSASLYHFTIHWRGYI